MPRQCCQAPMARSQLRLLRVRIVAFTLVDMHTHAQHVHCVFAKDFTASAWPWPQSLSMMNLLVDITSFWSSTLQAPATIVQGVRRMSCSDTRAADTERPANNMTTAILWTDLLWDFKSGRFMLVKKQAANAKRYLRVFRPCIVGLQRVGVLCW